MEPENQREVYEAINSNIHSPSLKNELYAKELFKEIHSGKTTPATKKDKKCSQDPLLLTSGSNQECFLSVPHNVLPAGAPASYNNSPSLQQVFNFSPSLVNYYHGGQGFPAGYPAGLHPPGVFQLPSGPGFLTGAGYHPGHTSSLFGGSRFLGCPLLPPGQAGTALHFAAIFGDKQKLSDVLQDQSVNLEARDRWGRVALVFAVLGNHQECVELLLRAGAKPDTVDSHGRTPLHFAAYKGRLSCIKALLHALESKSVSQLEHSSGAWLAQDIRGVTPLHHAAVHGNHKCLQALLKLALPGTLDTEDHKKRTPLHWAAAYGSEENVRLLIKYGANSLMPDQEGKTPLHWAAMSKTEGAKDCVRTLIGAAPSNANWQDFDGITALHLAVAEARTDTVDVILSVLKRNVDLTDNQFRTALHWACSRGLTTIVSRLLECGAHPYAVDVYGATPLHYAAKLNHVDTVELLVRRPCVRDDPTTDGHTSLLWAAAQGADSALTVMVRHGASLSQADPRGCTALHIAAGAGHVSTVGVLLHLRAQPDVLANDGRTPVLHAAQAGHAQIVKVLAKAGASLDHRDNEGQCALHHAVLGGHLYLAQILIKAGTSVNVKDYCGRTPLHMAAFRGLSDIMFLLLENRGDVNARDYEGMSALHWAAEQGHLGAVNTLLEFHAYPNYTQTTQDRYTPLDCAYVAEQLEVAQVLMEAGGISVTRIMEKAATKIQALVRGHITRSSLREEHRSLQGQEGKSISSKVLEAGRKYANRSIIDSINVQPASALLVAQGSHTAHNANESMLSVPSTVDVCDNLEEREEKEADAKLSSPAAFPSRTPFSEHSPYNSVSGRRRSKTLASSIMKGTRKKTLRNLELPGLGELGIGELKTPDDEDSDSGTDAVERPRLVVAEALQHSSKIVTALVTAGVCSQGDHHLQGDRVKEYINSCQYNENQSQLESLPKKSTDAQPQELGKLRAKMLATAVVDKKELIDNYNETNEVPGDENNSFCWHKTQLPSSCENRSEEENENYQNKYNYHEGLKSKVDDTKVNEFPPFKDKKHSLQINTAPSSNQDHNVMSSGCRRLAAETTGVRRVFSPDVLKQAERRWNNKLATLTLQKVQRSEPESSRADTTTSHNLAQSPGQLLTTDYNISTNIKEHWV